MKMTEWTQARILALEAKNKPETDLHQHLIIQELEVKEIMTPGKSQNCILQLNLTEI